MQETANTEERTSKEAYCAPCTSSFQFLQGFVFLQFWFIPEKNCNAVKRCSFRAKLFFGFFCSPKARLKENSRSGLDHPGAVIFLCLDPSGNAFSLLDQKLVQQLFLCRIRLVCYKVPGCLLQMQWNIIPL